MKPDFKKYIILWLSQSVSQLGSALTSFALILWAYEQHGSALTVSLMAFCNYVPYVLVGLIAGAFVDRHSKKQIMLAADTIAAVCSLSVLIFSGLGMFRVWHIYLINAVIGTTEAFQLPASSVAVGRLVPEEKLANASGMQSFSGNLVGIFAPVISAALYGLGGLKPVLILDFISFFAAFFVLLFFIPIPEPDAEKAFDTSQNPSGRTLFQGCREGFGFLGEHRGLLLMILTMAVMNFLSNMTFENVLSPMILSRIGGSSTALSLVNAAMSIGGITGGILVSAGITMKNPVKMIYIPAALSFFCGDLLLAMGQETWIWCMAGIFASLPIPFINAGQNVILYQHIPDEMRGRVFSARNALQFGTIPPALLLGGFLADYVMEPLMACPDRFPATALSIIVGSGAGSGMAAMFLFTGIFGGVFCLAISKRQELRSLQQNLLQ